MSDGDGATGTLRALAGAVPQEAAAARGTVAGIVYDRIRADIVRLRLAPGDRVSEAEVARRLGVSRQPVREAFIRLARQGLLEVRPQRPTTVVRISVEQILNAVFVRKALEEAVLRRALAAEGPRLAGALDAIIEAQRKSADRDDRDTFHALDEAFHQRICAAADAAFVWRLVDEQKAQVDRARFLTLGFNTGRVIAQHGAIRDAVARDDPDGAVAALGEHLSDIERHLPRIRAAFPDVFEPAGEAGLRKRGR